MPGICTTKSHIVQTASYFTLFSKMESQKAWLQNNVSHFSWFLCRKEILLHRETCKMSNEFFCSSRTSSAEQNKWLLTFSLTWAFKPCLLFCCLLSGFFLRHYSWMSWNNSFTFYFCFSPTASLCFVWLTDQVWQLVRWVSVTICDKVWHSLHLTDFHSNTGIVSWESNSYSLLVIVLVICHSTHQVKMWVLESF